MNRRRFMKLGCLMVPATFGAPLIFRANSIPVQSQAGFFSAKPAAPPPVGGYSIVSHTSKAGNNDTVTTDPQNTSAANIIIVAAGFYQNSPTLTDNQSNTWTALTKYGSGNHFVQLYYCIAPTVNSSHTFTLAATSSFPGLSVLSFSGAASPAFDTGKDQGSATLNSTTTRQASSAITPSVNNSLIISAITFGLNTFSPTVDSSMSTPDASVDGSNVNYAIAYKVQSTAASINPTWTISSGGSLASAVALAAFKPS